MCRFLILFAFLFVALAIAQQQQSSKPQSQKPHQAKKANSKKQAQSINAPQNSETFTAIKDAKNQIIEAIRETQKHQYDPHSDYLYRAYLWATVIGVIGGLIGLHFLIRQTKLTEIAAKAATAGTQAAKTSADAALKNATAMINAERAWIVADIEEPTRYVPDHIHRFVCHLRNTGKTPARIKEVAERAWVGSEAMPLPQSPTYTPDQIHPFSAHGGAVMAPNATMPRLVYVTPHDMKEVESGNRILNIHGYVIYEDTISGEEHVTKYGFYLNIPMGGADQITRVFYISDLPNYNEAT